MKINRSFLTAVCFTLSVLTLSGCKKSIEMIKVKGGTFTTAQINKISEVRIAQKDIMDENSPDFSLSVSDFYISKFEITQELYKKIMESDSEANAEPSYFCQDNYANEKQELRPVEKVTWYDAVAFCNALSKKEGLQPVYQIEGIQRYTKDYAIKKAEVTADFSKNGYRLPTHAEWLWAACGGVKERKILKYSGSNDIEEVAWHSFNSKEMTHQVGLRKPNALGIYDMTGNVAEWCWDCVWNDEFQNKEYVNYTGPQEGSYRYIKGGCFVEVSAGAPFPCETFEKLGGAQFLRYYNTGFRVVRNIKKSGK